MTLPLALILSYTVSIPFWYWLCRSTESSSTGLFDKACEAMPRTAWLFRFGQNIQGYLISPIVMAIVIICFPIICIQHFLRNRTNKNQQYSDPCFETVNTYVLDKEVGQRFDEFERILLNRGFNLIGTYKYKPDRLNQICRYFIAKNGKQIAMVYCMYGEFEITIGSVFSDGSVVLSSGISEKIMPLIEHAEVETLDFWWDRIEDLDPNRLLRRQAKMCGQWSDGGGRTLARIRSENWKKAAVHFSRLAAHTQVKLGHIALTDVPESTASLVLAWASSTVG